MDFPTLPANLWLRCASILGVALWLLALIAVLRILLAAAFGTAPDGTASEAGQPGTQGLSVGFGVGAILVAVLGVPFVLWRTHVAQKQADIAEQNHITDQINTAVEGLGAQREVSRIGRTVTIRSDDGTERFVIEWQNSPIAPTEGETIKVDEAGKTWSVLTHSVPNLEVRIGAIYALERIARQNLDEHIQIMEILTAYIRQNAPVSDAPPLHLPPFPGPADSDNVRPFREVIENWRAKSRQTLLEYRARNPVREDIQVAITVIGRRGQKQLERERGGAALYSKDVGGLNPFPRRANKAARATWNGELTRFRQKAELWRATQPRYRVDLRRTNLRGVDLSHGMFARADLRQADLTGAMAPRADMSGARLEGAVLTGALLSSARLAGAALDGAWLQGAILRWADLPAARLNGAHLDGVYADRAQLEGADLHSAGLAGAILREARLEGANLRSTEALAVEFYNAQLSGASLHTAFLQDADITGANLVAAVIQGTHLEGADLSSVSLDVAFLGNLSFNDQTRFEPRTMRGAAIRDVDLRALNITVENLADRLSEAFGDGSVILPDGLQAGTGVLEHWPATDLGRDKFREVWGGLGA